MESDKIEPQRDLRLFSSVTILHGKAKVRKLEFLLADARDKGADVVLTGGNLILDGIFGAEVRLVDTDSYDDVYAKMDRIMERLWAQGHTPYAIPVGGSVTFDKKYFGCSRNTGKCYRLFSRLVVE